MTFIGLLVDCVYVCPTTFLCCLFFFLMIRRPPRSTLDRSSAASDVYKRQDQMTVVVSGGSGAITYQWQSSTDGSTGWADATGTGATTATYTPVSYTHLRAHETVLDLVCRLLLEKKNRILQNARICTTRIRIN